MTNQMQNDCMTREGEVMPGAARRKMQFCSASAEAQSTNIPLRVKNEYRGRLLADSEFKMIPTEELIYLAKSRRVYTVDRSSAIAVLKGLSRLDSQPAGEDTTERARR